MKKFTLLLTLGIFFSSAFFAYGGINVPIKKMLTSDWLQDNYHKWGLVGSFTLAHGLNGLTESYKFSGRHIVTDDDYHIYKTGRDVSLLVAGYFFNANIRTKRLKWYQKGCRILGTLCWGRNSHELMYRWNRTGDPFNYSAKYTSNEKAIVYFKWSSDKGKIVDAYISGVGKQGALIDLAFLIVGKLLLDI